MNTVTITLKNGVPTYRSKKVLLPPKIMRLLIMNGGKVTIWSKNLKYAAEN